MIVIHGKHKIYLRQGKVETLISIMIAKNSNLFNFLKDVKETNQVVHIGKS